jgi:CheY-like chemotaxis protein
MSLPILIVEDNYINHEVAKLNLRRLGFEAVVANDGPAAVELARQQQFAAILMDVMMPQMDGYEAARQIREFEATIGRRTPIIAVSAWSAADNRQRCLDAGMDDYLSKPYDHNALKRVLERFVTVSSC